MNTKDLKRDTFMIYTTHGKKKAICARVTVGDTEGVGYIDGNNKLLSFMPLSDFKKQAKNGPRLKFDEECLPDRNAC